MAVKKQSSRKSPTTSATKPKDAITFGRSCTVIPNGLKYHFEAEEGVLKAIGTAADCGSKS